MIVAQRAIPSTPRDGVWEVAIMWSIPAGPQFHGLPSTYIPAFSYEHAHAIAAAINSFAITHEVAS